MRVPTRKDRDGLGAATMTPMIDVVFNLMIFFVCTVSFQAVEYMLPTTLSAPQAAAATPVDVEREELETVVVKVALVDGRLSLSVAEARCDSLSALRDLLRTLAEHDHKLPVILDVQGDVPLGDVVSVYDVCLLSGFQRVQFAASAET
jgi:biopolymer transport protein ExbD